MTIGELYRQSLSLFQQAGFSRPDLEAAVLMEAALDVTRAGLVLAADRVLTDDEIHAVRRMVSRRLAHEPVSYITGRREFWSRPFAVTSSVLVPRPETEVLIERVLDVRDQLPPGPLLDLGVGSGVILITLLLEMDSRKGVGVDCSIAALAIARENGSRHGLDDRVQWVVTDWFDGLMPSRRFALITSNPPYIARDCLAGLPEDVRREPRVALDGGRRGLESLSVIIQKSAAYLLPGGYLFMEIGADQETEVLELLRCPSGQNGSPLFSDATVYPDYAGRPRVAGARRTSACS